MTAGGDEIFYHHAGMADHASTVLAISQGLDQIREEAQQLLSSSPDFFDTPQGSQQYQQIMTLINQGIEEGKNVLYNQSGTILDVGSNMSHTDTIVGQGFEGC